MNAILLAQAGPLQPDVIDAAQDQAGVLRLVAGFSNAPLPVVVGGIISMFLGLIGMIFISLIVYAGYNWITARGNSEKIETAKDTIRQAIWGVILTFAAYSIGYFLLQSYFTYLESASSGGAFGSP